MNQKQKDLVIKALGASDVCSTWKDEIKKVFPELVEKLKMNIWYSLSDNFLQFHTGQSDNIGWNLTGKWSTTLGTAFAEEFKEASEEYVKARLIKEAKKRGLIPGNLVQNNIHTRPFTISDSKLYEFSFNHNTLWVRAKESHNTGKFSLFKDGEWAKLCITKKEAEKTLGKIIID